MDVGDEILALDGFRVRTSDLNDRIAILKPGDTVTLTVFRNDRLRDFKVTAGVLPLPTFSVTTVPTPTDLQKHIFESWLKASWTSPSATGNANR